MIYEITKELATKLSARQVPWRVIYGPERTQTVVPVDPRIVVSRDRKGGDEFPGFRSLHRPPSRGLRRLGVSVRVFAQSTVAGARVQDHERLGDAAVDQVQAALYEIGKIRKTELTLVSGRYLDAAELELEGLLTWPGVVYELRFTVDRNVVDRDWAQVAAEEVEAGTDVTVTSTTQVRLATSNGAPETACGV